MSISASEFEAQHVHSVYSQIANDFSRTRHTRWPFIERFMSTLPIGSVVLDAGCGNGKYLAWRNVLPITPPQANQKAQKKHAETQKMEEKGLVNIGLDMSEGLLAVARGRGNEVVRGDCVDLSCWRPGIFDHAISIATIHHFSTRERRKESIKQLFKAITPPTPKESTPGYVFIVVWSLEQDPNFAGAGSARKSKKGVLPIPSNTEIIDQKPTNSLLEDQDVFVAWSLSLSKAEKEAQTKEAKENQPESFNRYYHLFKYGELSELVQEVEKELDEVLREPGWKLVLDVGEGEWWERENWAIKVQVQWKKCV